MRFRGRAALTVAILAAALAFNKPPMHDAYAKGNKSVTPKYAPKDWKKGDGNAAKLLKDARNIKPKNYKMEEVKKAVEAGIEMLSNMKINENGGFGFSIKPMPLSSGLILRGKVKVGYPDKKPEFANNVIIKKCKKTGGCWRPKSLRQWKSRLRKP